MFSVTTIREQAGRAGRVFTGTRRTIPGPLGLLLQFVMLIVLIGAVLLLALPVIVLGGFFLVCGLGYAAARRMARSTRSRMGGDGRENVRVIERSDTPNPVA